MIDITSIKYSFSLNCYKQKQTLGIHMAQYNFEHGEAVKYLNSF